MKKITYNAEDISTALGALNSISVRGADSVKCLAVCFDILQRGEISQTKDEATPKGVKGDGC